VKDFTRLLLANLVLVLSVVQGDHSRNGTDTSPHFSSPLLVISGIMYTSVL